MRFGYRCCVVVLFTTLPSVAQVNSAIQVPVTLLEKRDQSVTLDKSTLRVLIDKAPAQVGNVVAPQGTPLDFVVAVDLSGSAKERADYVKSAAVELFHALQNENGSGFLLLFGENVVISSRPLTEDAVKEILDKVAPRGGSPIYDSIIKASDTLSQLPSAGSHRRAIIVISDGEDNQSGHTRQEAIEVAVRCGTPVFAIYSTGKAEGRGRAPLQETARATGGQFLDPGHPAEAVPKVAEMLAQQYLVTFTAPTLNSKDHHSLRVDSNIRVLAPQEYVPSIK